MKILGFAWRPKDITAVVQTLRGHAIKVTGPYQTPKGTVIYTFADCVVTERELLDLAKAENLEVVFSEFAAKVMSKHGH